MIDKDELAIMVDQKPLNNGRSQAPQVVKGWNGDMRKKSFSK